MSAKTAAKKQTTEQIVTERILNLIRDDDTIPWRKGFITASSHYKGPISPHNLTTQRPYRGINTLLTLIAQWEGNYTVPAWLTYKQAQKAGGQVMGGEKSTGIVFHGVLYIDPETGERIPDDKQDDIDLSACDKRFFLRLYNVFNAEQCEGLESLLNPDDLPVTQSVPGSEREQAVIAALEDRIRRSGVELIHRDCPSAYYRPSDHLIVIPDTVQFESPARYFAMLAHEAAHSTVAELGRNMDFSDKQKLAMEELVAELASVMMCVECGIDGPELEGMAACYIETWQIEGLLESNPKAIFVAAAQAQKAVDFLLDDTLRLALSESQTLSTQSEAVADDFQIDTGNASNTLDLNDVMDFIDTATPDAPPPSFEPEASAHDDLDEALSSTLKRIKETQHLELNDLNDEQVDGPSLTFDPASLITIAADSIEQLREVDVWRVLDSAAQIGTAEALAMADYLVTHRNDLANEVKIVMRDELALDYADPIPTLEDPPYQTMTQTDRKTATFDDLLGFK